LLGLSLPSFFLAGRCDNQEFNSSLQELITREITPEVLKHGIKFSVLHYSPDTWEEEINVVLRDHNPSKSFRWFFTLNRLRVNRAKRVPFGFRVEHIDDTLLKRTNLTNIDKIAEYVVFKWGSIHNFVRSGFGFCLIYRDKIVSWCISGNNVRGKCDITIGTAENYRKRGFATIVASALIEYCLSKKFTPRWYCGSKNLSSIAVAEKMGFEKKLMYPVITWVPKAQPHSRWRLRNKPKMLSSIAKALRNITN
jgi:RimJ/RimL family protein N-acetyltransferase